MIDEDIYARFSATTDAEYAGRAHGWTPRSGFDFALTFDVQSIAKSVAHKHEGQDQEHNANPRSQR